MRARQRLAIGLMLGLAGLPTVTLAGHQTAPSAAEARAKALVAFQRDLVSVLAPRADAQPLLGAALLARPLGNQPAPASFHALIERAAKADGAGPAVQWARLTDCDATAQACPNADALAALTREAGDNAAVWLLKLGLDSANGHHDDVREDLRRAATARFYDDYTGTALQALATTVGTLPPPTPAIDPASPAGAWGVQVVMVFGVSGLLPAPQPGMQATARLCEEGKDDPASRESCLQLARVLEWGSSPLARSLGLHLRETLSDDTDARAAARTEMANLAWEVRNFAELSARAADDKALAQHLLALARNGGTEMSLMLAALRDAGIPTDAPGASEAATTASAAPASP